MGDKGCRGMVLRWPILEKQCPVLKAALPFYDDYASPIYRCAVCRHYISSSLVLRLTHLGTLKTSKFMRIKRLHSALTEDFESNSAGGGNLVIWRAIVFEQGWPKSPEALTESHWKQ